MISIARTTSSGPILLAIGIVLALSSPANAEHAAAPPPAEWTGLQRFYVKARPFYIPPYNGGVATEIGYEHIMKSGLKFGVAMDPLYLGFPLIGSFTLRVDIGYATRAFGVSLGLGSGYPLFYPQFSSAFRFGRYDGFHVTFRASFAFNPIPTAVELDFNIPTTEKNRFTINLACGSELTYPYGCLSGHFLLGLQRYLSGSGLRGTSIFTFGAGLAFALSPIPGPLLSFGYERRF